jgi:hypothetical protein
MKIKEELNLEVLFNYGFTKINKEEEKENEQHAIARYEFKFEIGHAIRGQFYYLLVSEKERNIIIYASNPDGSGGSVACPDVLIKLYIDGIIC